MCAWSRTPHAYIRVRVACVSRLRLHPNQLLTATAAEQLSCSIIPGLSEAPKPSKSTSR
jgi:hypothetical protein